MAQKPWIGGWIVHTAIPFVHRHGVGRGGTKLLPPAATLVLGVARLQDA